MKKILLFALVIAVLFLGCSSSGGDDSSAYQLRVENMLTEGGAPRAINYGVKFGPTEFVMAIPSGTTTNYVDAEPGAYSVQLLAVDGSWYVMFSGMLSIAGEGKYTLLIWGDTEDETYAQIVRDE